ncbi:MAG: signal peptide peptidase SppA [Alphaproteobacteria bacterium]|nr:signal peptide peptidase SppA [Alphaproteobacteria bacterium]
MRNMSFDVFALRKKTAIKILLKSLIWAFALFGSLFILVLALLVGYIKSPAVMVEVPEKTILTINFDTPISETRQDSLLTEVVPSSGMSFTDILTVMEVALFDDRVKAVAAKINDSGLGLAQTMELAQTMMRYRQAGKETYIFSSGFGNMVGGTSEYLLASSFGKITMMPGSYLGVTGVGIEVPFARTLLDKVGVFPDFYARYEYKGGMASFTDKKVPEAFKMNMKFLLADLNMSVLKQMMGFRYTDVTGRETLDILDKAPLDAEYARSLGLVDKIDYEADWIDEIKDKYDAETLNIDDYASTIHWNDNGKKIAVMILEGVIVDVANMSLSGEKEISSEQVLDQIDEIKKDKDVVGILVRVNSPGGSYSASSEIWNALNKLKKEKNVPLYVSMGDYAASGGYFVSLAGDKIYAVNTTITGSIGVFGGKFVLEELWKKMGVEWEVFAANSNASMLSPNFKFNGKQREIFENSLDRIYKDFTEKTTKARKLDEKETDSLTRGRVWSGKQAFEYRLIDELGGFNDALSELKIKSGIKEDEKFVLDIYPKPKTLQEKLSEVIGMSPLNNVKVTGKYFGVDSEMLNVLKMLQYNAVMPPMVLTY